MKIKKTVASAIATVILTSCMCRTVSIEVNAVGIERQLVTRETQVDDGDFASGSESKLRSEMTEVKKQKSEKRLWNSSMYGVSECTGATAKGLDELINEIIEYRGLSYCPFKGKGDTLEKIEKEYEISAIALLGMWTWESSFGTSPLAINNHNYGGIKNSGGGYRYYDSIKDGMEGAGKLIREAYVDEGYTTYSLIASKYCPGNTTWAENVSSSAQKYAEWLADIIE